MQAVIRTSTLVFLVTILLGIQNTSFAMNEGCVIHQTFGPERTLIRHGYIAQTFVPCSDGDLDYLTLFLNSLDETSFSTYLEIFEVSQGVAISLGKQQVVIPGIDQEAEVKLWLAGDIELRAGLQYMIELHALEGSAFQVHYARSDEYGSGQLFRNGLRSGGDMAFELGVRHKNQIANGPKPLFKIKSKQRGPETDPCELKQLEADFEFVFEEDTPLQSFLTCNNIEVSGLEIKYISEIERSGRVFFYRWNEESMQETLQMDVILSPSDGDWSNIELPYEIEFQADQVYAFELELEQNQPFIMLGSNMGAYSGGELIMSNYVADLDLAFSLEYNDVPEAVTGTFYPTVPSMDCRSGVTEYNGELQVNNGQLIQRFVPCANGELQVIQLPVDYINSEDGVCTYKILASNGEARWHGSFTQDDVEMGELTLNGGSIPVVDELTYSLVLIIPAGEEVIFYTNSNGEAFEGDLVFNEMGQTKDLCLSVGVDTFEFDFEEVEAERASIGLRVFPNPFTTQFSVSLMGEAEGNGILSLYNFLGHEIYRAPIEDVRSIQNWQVIPGNDLMPGYYTIRLEFENQVILETIIKR